MLRIPVCSFTSRFIASPLQSVMSFRAAPRPIDRVFLFGKHYGKSYNEVYESQPRYVFHLQNLLRKMYDEQSNQATQDSSPEFDSKNKLIADIKDYLLYARSRREVERLMSNQATSNSETEKRSPN